MALTADQKKALDFSRNISVTAGAGAGKTRLLVERFLEIVLNHYREQPQKVRRIIAITFTNKAAGEMRQRIAMAVKDRLKDAQDPQEKHCLRTIRDQLNSVAISTIHSFCTRLLREYPIEAQLPPDFSELDEMQSQLLMNQAIEQLFDDIKQNIKPEYAELFQYFEAVRIRQLLSRALSQPYEMHLIAGQFQNFNDQNDFFDFIARRWHQAMEQLLPVQKLRVMFTLCEQLTGQLINETDADARAIKKFEHIRQMAALKQKTHLDVNDYQQVRQALMAFTTKGKAYKNLSQFGGQNSWRSQGKDLILKLSALSAGLLEPLQLFDPGEPPGDSDRLYYRHFKTILTLYQQARDYYENLKAEIPALDFEDLLVRTYHLLANNQQVRRQLVQRYDFIMVDEFQDTNALQWRIIEFLSSEHDRLQSNKIFVVGDPKQSIYGFRNADIRIFKTVKEQLAQNAGAPSTELYEGNIVLKESFRFLPRLNAFINAFFKELFTPGEQNPYEVDFEPLIARRKLSEKGQLEIAILNDDPRQSEEEYIAQTIERLVRLDKVTYHQPQENGELEQPLTFGDIAILLRSRQSLLAVETTLRQHNIPFKTVKGIGYWQQQEVADFYHLLHFLVTPESDFYLVAVLRSKLFLIPDDVLYLLSREQGAHFWEKLNGPLEGSFLGYRAKLMQVRALLNRWLSLRDLIPLGDLLRLLLKELNYKALISAQLNGEQLLANIEKFIDHVYTFKKSGLNGLLELLEQLEILIEENAKEGEPQINLEDKSTVKIMTIHAAKGLQFPVVFVPYLNTGNLDNKRQNVFLEPEIGLAVDFRSDLQNEAQNFTLLNLLKVEKKKRDLAEAKRLLYVAVTRASEHLFLSAKVKKNGIKAHSALDWLNRFFLRQGLKIDLADEQSTTIEADGYRLQIVRRISPSTATSHSMAQIKQGLQILRKTLHEAPILDKENVKWFLPLQDQPSGMVFSATRLMTYLKDPESYYQRYHLGFFESDYELFAENIYKMDESLVKGKIFHRFLELMTSQTGDQREVLERIFFEFEIFDAEKRNQLAQEILFLKEKMERSAIGVQLLQAKNAQNELSVTMSLGQDFFTGTIDRIIKNEQGWWKVIDYKTNHIRADQVAEKAQDYQWQMKGYALLLSQLFPQQQQFPVALYFVLPDELFERTYTKKDIEEIQNTFVSLIEKIKRQYPVG